MLKALAGIILRQRVILLIALLLITAFLAYRATFVRLSYESARILPDTDSSYTEYKSFKEKFGEDGTVMVIGFQSRDIFRLDVFNDWYTLTDSIKKIEGIQEVISVARCFQLVRNDSLQRLDLKPLLAKQPGTQPEVDSLKAKLTAIPFYEGLLFNSKSNVTLMAITLDQDKLNTKSRIETVAQVKDAADLFASKNHLALHYSGLPFIRTAVSQKILGEMILFLVLALLVTTIILYIFFRSRYAVLFPMIVVIFGVIWSFGTLDLFGFRITILTSLIAPLIVVIGIPNCILLLNKYQQEFNNHGNKIKALARSIQRIGVTTFFANVTTAIGFLVFYFTKSEVLQEFGIIAALNVMLTYLISLVFIPIVFSFLPPPSSKQVRHLDSKVVNYMLGKIDHWVHHYRWRIYAFVALVISLSVYGAFKISTVGFVVDDLPKKNVIYTDLKFFEENFRGVLPFEITIDTKKRGGALALATLYKINRLQKMIAGYPEFSKPVSIAEGIKLSYQGLNDNESKFYVLPNAEEMARLSGYATTAKENEHMFHSMIDSTKQLTRISFQVADIGSIRMKTLLAQIKPRVDSIFDPQQYVVKMTGNSIIFLKNNDYLLINLKESILLAILLIGAVMFLLFLSFRMIVISLIPSLIPLLITAGMMGFLGIPLKPSTILIFSIAFGIASDGTMYFLTKYRQELRHQGGSISKTVSKTIHETGVSMIYTAVILFCGFFIFTASDFGGTAALGMLISLTLLIAMCSNLIFLPTLLLSLERLIITKAFLKEPLIQLYDEEEDVELDNLEIRKN